MSTPNLEEEIYAHLQQLSLEQQQQVLEFVRALVATRVGGVPGRTLLRFAGAINASNLTTMAQAVEEGCEHIHAEEW
jgi:hypothetical protein